MGALSTLRGIVVVLCICCAGGGQAQTYFKPGEFEDARRIYLEAHSIEQAGRYREAAAGYEKAWKLVAAQAGPDHPAAIEAQAAYAYALMLAGATPSALPIQQDALARATRVFGAQNRTTLRLTNNLAAMLVNLDRLSEALLYAGDSYRKSLATLGEGDFVTLGAVYDLGEIYRKLGRPAEGTPLLASGFQASLKSRGPTDDMTMALLSELGASLLMERRTNEAVAVYERALQSHITKSGERHPLTIISLSRLAMAYGEANRWQDELKVRQKSLPLALEVLGERHQTTITEIQNLGASYARARRFGEAEPLLARACGLWDATVGELAWQSISCLGIWAGNSGNQGKNNDASRQYAMVIDRIERRRTAAGLTERNRQALFAGDVVRYREFVRVLSRTGQREEAFRIAERMKARTLVELVAERDASNTAIADPAERAAWDKLDTTLSALSGRIAVAQRGSDRVLLEDERNRVHAQREAQRIAMTNKYPTFQALLEPQPVEPDEARALLPVDTAFVSFVQNIDYLLVLIVTREGITTHELERWPQLSQSLIAYLKVVSSPGGIAGFTRVTRQSIWELPNGALALGINPPHPQAQRLESDDDLADRVATRLVKPWYGSVARHKRIMISPDGPLSLVPFDSLRINGRYLIESHDLQLVSSFALLKLLQEREARNAALTDRKDVFAMGGARFQLTRKVISPGLIIETRERDANPARTPYSPISRDDPNAVEKMFAQLNIEWLTLPGTDNEVKAVAGLFPAGRSTAFVGDDATEAKLEEWNRSGELAKHRYLLFSTHGYLNLREPALSAIVLGQIRPEKGTDGFVTAAEFSRYRLQSDLVVLSACETGVGQFVHGEGVMGLPFALFQAGNRNTLLTLWSVENESSQQFTRSLFEKLRDGMPQYAAVAAAKRELLASSRYRNAYFWAPYALYGN
jgi:CHAT domain-containing protein/tetratricopeptide (TPR) repeat protein